MSKVPEIVYRYILNNHLDATTVVIHRIDLIDQKGYNYMFKNQSYFVSFKDLNDYRSQLIQLGML